MLDNEFRHLKLDHKIHNPNTNRRFSTFNALWNNELHECLQG